MKFKYVSLIFVLGSTPDLWPPYRPKMLNRSHILTAESTINVDNVFSGHVGGVEHVHEAIGVGVLVSVLLREGRDLLHVVICDKKFSVIFPN